MPANQNTWSLMQRKQVCMCFEAELEHFIAQNANNKVIYSVAEQ